MTTPRKPPSHGDRGGAGKRVLKGQHLTARNTPQLPTGTTLSVACPSCRAQPQAKCRTAAGKETGAHPSRVRMATRADNARREADGTLGVRRGAAQVDTVDGRTCPRCGLKIRLAKPYAARPYDVLVSHTRTGAKVGTLDACDGSGLRLPPPA